MPKKINYFLIIILIVFTCKNSIAQCDCGSTDANYPCTGRSISVTVTAGIPNGGMAIDNIYNWSFHSGGGEARCGQFANGDYWVAPAKGQTTVTITEVKGSGYLSLDADPIPERTGLLGTANKYGNYVESENIITKLPIDYSNTTSLVASIQRNENMEGACGTKAILGSCVDSYNVLTVLPSAPENNGTDRIRPNITGTKKYFFKLSDFNLTQLPSKNYFTGLSKDEIELIRQRWSHSTEIFGIFNSTNESGWSEGGRAFRSHILIDDYGAGTAVAWFSDVTRLLSTENTYHEKIKALSAILTYGQDIFATVYNPANGTTRWFGVGATQSAGRFPPAVFFAALLRDKNFSNIISTAGKNGRGLASVGPHELTQVQPGKNFPIWGDVIFGNLEEDAYWGSLFKSQCYDGATGVCDISTGKRTGRDPYGYIDGPSNRPGVGYMNTSLGPQRSLAALMYLIPTVCEAVNYDDLLIYLDRIQNEGIRTADDPCVTPDSREDTATCEPYKKSGCKYYKITWGPDPDKPGECIKTATPPYTKQSRFGKLDKSMIKAGYTTAQIEKNWSIIKEDQIHCKRDNPSHSPHILLIK
ncbi:hypothetical protein [Desulfobulbus elongatus]|uniref:hypothetical protein n=1 Tax=Desulfobulbus elongatus TaxID=53332 RepID=UPI000B2BD5B6|nr:hypothetical protein [Desulfobulbus elongatus]